MTASEAYSEALTRELALAGAVKALHIARNTTLCGDDRAVRDRLQALLSSVIDEQEIASELRRALAEKME